MLKVSQLLAILCVLVAGALLWLGWNDRPLPLPKVKRTEKGKGIAGLGFEVYFTNVAFQHTKLWKETHECVSVSEAGEESDAE